MFEDSKASLRIDLANMGELRRHLQQLHHSKLDVFGLGSIPLPRLNDRIVAIKCYQMPPLARSERAARGEAAELLVPHGRPALPLMLPKDNTPYHHATTTILDAAMTYRDDLPPKTMRQAVHFLSNGYSEPPDGLMEVLFQLMRPATRRIYERSIGSPWWNWFKYLSSDDDSHDANIEDMFNQAINPVALWAEMKTIIRTLRASNCFTKWEDTVRAWVHLSICRQLAMCFETHNFRRLERAFFKDKRVVFRATEAGQEAPDWQNQIVRRYPGRVRLSYDGIPLPVENIVHISSCGSFVVHRDRRPS